MPVSLKLISLNIERSRHLDVVLPFLERMQPDVVCIQELLQPDIARIAAASGAVDSLFTPMSRRMVDVPGALYGMGIFSRIPIVARGEQYYVGQSGVVPESAATDTLAYNDEYRAVAWVDVEKDGAAFRIATTHFTWTSNGDVSEEQRRDMKALMQVLDSVGDVVLTGDFNAPRGGEMFAMLSARCKDNIPAHYTTTIDKNFHRAGDLQYVVDGLFSTPEYTVSDVRLVDGLSDHMAVVATISKS